jgi:predicted dehydrogenase
MLRVGVAGYGVVGRRRQKHIDERDDMQTVAVCDRVFEGSGQIETGANFYNNYRSMMVKEKLDVLFVCMTNDIASEVTIAGLEAGMHVFCEKPPGRNIQDIKNVRATESKCPDLKLMYGFNHRYHDSVQDAIRIVNSNELGKVMNLRGVYGKAKMLTFDQDDWRTKRDIAGGGILLDQGIHMVDLMRLFGGEFVDVHSYISNDYWGFDVEDNAYALMRTQTGIVGMLHSSATQWRHRFFLDINLEKGSINLGGILTGSKSYGAETMTVVWANPDDDEGDPREQMTRYNKDTSWANEIAEFSNAIKTEKPIQFGGSKDALLTMQLVYDIYKADKKWKKKYNIV